MGNKKGKNNHYFQKWIGLLKKSPSTKRIMDLYVSITTANKKCNNETQLQQNVAVKPNNNPIAIRNSILTSHSENCLNTEDKKSKTVDNILVRNSVITCQEEGNRLLTSQILDN